MTKRSMLWFNAAAAIVYLLVTGALVYAAPDHAREPEGCLCLGTVGNVDCDYADIVDIADLTLLVDYLFITHPPLPNRQEANVDGDPAGMVDIGDLTLLIDYLYISSPELPPCPTPFNNPPETEILVTYSSYINAEIPGSPVTGIPVEWRGYDLVDHPYYPPPFEFEWRLYGPYPTDILDDSTWEYLHNQFIKTAFLRKTGDLLFQGEGLSFVVCDTVPTPVGEDSIFLDITCDTILVDTITISNDYGRLDTLLNIDDPAFANDPAFNRIAASSAWTTDTTDTIYNVFADDPSDTTLSRPFMLWVRARDPMDSTILDPTPAFQPLYVIDPKFERDIALVDLQLSFSVNARIKDSARAFWTNAIDTWATNTGKDIHYVDSIDYWTASSMMRPFTSLDMFSYKVIVLLNDNTVPGMMVNNIFADQIFRAISAGVSVWSAQRAAVFGGEAWVPTFAIFSHLGSDPAYGFYFGLDQMVYSGWEWHLLLRDPPVRIEDFIGLSSADSNLWPEVPIDTALLHRRYLWRGQYPWIDSIAALPEVNWAQPADGAEVMFTYQSLYPEGHFLNDTNFNFHGRPVAQRYETTLFRTAHWLFTPYAFEEGSMQTAIDSVLNWLYDPYLTEPVRQSRYPDAGVKITADDIRQLNTSRTPSHQSSNPGER